MISFNISNWYWSVVGNSTQVFSSASMSFVAVSNSTHVSWLASGNHPSVIANATELAEVLNEQWAPTFLANGVALQSTGTPSLNATYPLDTISQGEIASISTGIAAGKGLPGGGSTFAFNEITFTSAEFLSVAAALESYVYNVSQSILTIVTTGSGSMPTVPLVIA